MRPREKEENGKALSSKNLQQFLNNLLKTGLPEGVECVTVADVGGIWTLVLWRSSSGV